MTGETLITAASLEDIARGAAVLGSGGGGDPYIGRLLAERALAAYGNVRLVSLDDVPDSATVVPLAMMGAPTVVIEKPPAQGQFVSALRCMEASLGRAATHLVCLEAGGLNSLIPVVAAAEAGLPLVDADGMGRAFPELQMVLPGLNGIPAAPVAMADDIGDTVTIRAADNTKAERLARAVTIEMGCRAAIALYAMTGSQARVSLINGSLSLAERIGAVIRSSRLAHGDTAGAVAAAAHGQVLFAGKVVDVHQRTEGGFARGEADLSGLGMYEGTVARIRFQNEYLLILQGTEMLACVPDIICLLDKESGEPITTESLRYGLRVVVVALPCHERWRTDEGLALVGPGYFGYEFVYSPIDSTVVRTGRANHS